MKTVFISLSLLAAGCVFGQQTNIWHFGTNAGMDFNGGNPVPIGTGITNAFEGTASICDNSGNLLFYTEGSFVRDRNHNFMPNGTGLQGGPSATQCLIVPKPGDCGIYYIFHAGDHMTNNNQGDLRYTMVDMCLNNGLGDVIAAQKNILLHQPSAEKITAVKHSNGVDTWVITHDRASSDWRVFLVSAAGVGAPVVSTSGNFHAFMAMIGPVKASHNGLKLATSCTFGNLLDIHDFDPSTGIVSNGTSIYNLITPYGGRAYGLEFSPNDQLLYISTCTTGNYVLQVDLAANTIVQIAVSNQSAYDFGMIQTGPDGKLYIAHNTQNYLDVINSPDTPGPGCNFVSAGFTLSPGTFSQLGLPNEVFWVYPSSSTFAFSLGNDTAVCFPYTLTGPQFCGASYSWSTGATTSSISISGPGSYSLQVNGTCGTGVDTITITSGIAQPLTVAGSTTLCQGQSSALTASAGFTNYTWSPASSLNASTGNTVTATPAATTTYTVIGSGGCGSDTTTVTVTINPLPVLNAASATICNGGSTVLNVNGAATYSWSPATGLSATTGSSVTATPTASTTYVITGTDPNGCSDTVQVNVTVTGPVLTVQGGSPLCEGDSLQLTVNGATTYTWSPSGSLSASTGSAVTAFPTTTTTYTITGTDNNGCTGTTTLVITVSPHPVVTCTNTSVCQGASTILNAGGAATYTWSPSSSLSASTGSSVSASPVVTTTYTITGVSQGGCSDTTTVTVTVNPLPVVTVPTPLPFCAGSSATLTASGGASYSWTPAANLSAPTGSTVTANPTATTTYTVIATDANGCTNSVGVLVTVNPLPVLAISSNTQVCSGDSVTLTVSGASGYSWTPSGSLSSGTGSSVFAFPSQTTVYTVYGTDANGCTSAASVTVSVYNNAAAQFTSFSQPCKNGVSFTNQSVGALEYFWEFGDGNTSVLENPQHTYELSGNYTVTLIINPGSSCADTSSFQLTYENYGPENVYIPNAFTPNQSGLNDVFVLYGPVGCNYEELSIFNRWGELIFQTSDPEHDFWDGFYEGNLVQEGVYVYRLVDRNTGGMLIGSVTVIR